MVLLPWEEEWTAVYCISLFLNGSVVGGAAHGSMSFVDTYIRVPVVMCRVDAESAKNGLHVAHAQGGENGQESALSCRCGLVQTGRASSFGTACELFFVVPSCDIEESLYTIPFFRMGSPIIQCCG